MARSDMETTLQQMSCMEVWGGSELTDRSTEFSGLEAWVYSRPYGQSPRGGDVVYASSCATGRITRLMLADVAGHGQAVAATAADLRLLMRRFVNCLDQTELVRLLNRRFGDLSAQASYATAVVATFFAPTRTLTLCNAGHPRPLIYRAALREWSLLGQDAAPAAPGPRNLPLGMMDIADYDQVDLEMQEGDCLLAYTDALIESQDADGEMLGEQGLHRIVRLLGDTEPARLIPTLLAEIGDRYPDNLSTDDLTVLVARASARELTYSLGQKTRAFVRFLGSALGSWLPGVERPPVPDFHIANVGGAVVPALSQRWQRRSSG